MPALEDYVYAMEALEEAGITASGLAVLAVAAEATGTCGVTTAGQGLELPLPYVAASGDWSPAAACPLPLPEVLAATSLWHPAWGAPSLPLPDVAALASPAFQVRLALTPLFTLARTGAIGDLSLPLADVAARYDLNRTGQAACSLPAPTAKALACGLDSPVTNALGSDAVVGLLCRGEAELAALAAAWTGGAVGGDAVAARLLAAVAGAVTYVAEPDGADVWTCALATAARGSGDCEDGALLLHGLLLAAGIAADRLVTAFGRVGIDKTGHAWLAYRRESDGVWVALDWTLGAGQGPVSGLPVMGEAAFYSLVDYALTAAAFFTVRETAAAFFARCRAEAVALPALTVEAVASEGGRASADLAEGWLTCRAAGGAFGRCQVPACAMAATAGSARGEAACPALSATALAGGAGTATAFRPTVVGAAGASARSAARLPSLRGHGEAQAGRQVAGVFSLAAWRGLARAATGGVGAAGCLLPRPGVRLAAVGGAVAAGTLKPAALCCLADAPGLALGEALAQVPALRARAQAAAAGDGSAYHFDTAAGEEWA